CEAGGRGGGMRSPCQGGAVMANLTPKFSLENEIEFPVLLNPWKHHAGALRQRIAEAVPAGEAGLQQLARELVVLGSELMDLYVGRLTPAGVGPKVLAVLRADGP